MSAVQDRCPRCDSPNQCAIASGGSACWCFEVRTDAGATVSGELRGDQSSCLCPRCLNAARAIEARVLSWKRASLMVTLGVEEAGAGPSLVLLPALSSISTRAEMRGLLERLAVHFRVRSADWPGFGDRARPRADWSPALLSAYLEWLLGEAFTPLHAVIAAGHAAQLRAAALQHSPGTDPEPRARGTDLAWPPCPP